MKLIGTFATLATLLSCALSAPTSTDLAKRATTICGQWDQLNEGKYILYSDQWGLSSATSGSQCLTFNSISGDTVNWSTAWTWAGGSSSVKSFSQVSWTINKTLSSIKTIPSVWKWSYTGSNIVADVAYDTWLAPSASASPSFEVMIWLAALGGAFPISSTGSPVATVTIGNATWRLYKGQNGSFTVFSFVATSQQNNFSGDLMQFYNYLSTNQGVSKSLVLQAIQSGTEPFTGSNAVLSSSAYSVTTT